MSGCGCGGGNYRPPTKTTESCEERVSAGLVPNTSCTLGITVDGVTATVDLKEPIHNCESQTKMSLNTTTGCIEYENEAYVSSDGLSGQLQTVCAEDLAEFINLEDLGNVEDTAPEHCSLLSYRVSSDCGPNCTGVTDKWVHWYAEDNLVTADDEIAYMAVFNKAGCLKAWAAPEGNEVATIIGRNGKWELNVYVLPEGVDPNDVGASIGNKNIYGVIENGTAVDKSTFIASHPLDENECGDLAFTSGVN